MTGTDPATLAQFKLLAQQAADIALTEQAGAIAAIQRNIELLAAKILPEDGDETIPGVLKWLVGIAAGVISAIILGALFWVASSMTDMQQTLARIDERQKAQTEGLDRRFADQDHIAGPAATKANPSILLGKTVAQFLTWLHGKTGE